MKLRLIDDNGCVWLWDGKWLDMDHYLDQKRDLTSGYSATTFEEVYKVLFDAGFID